MASVGWKHQVIIFSAAGSVCSYFRYINFTSTTSILLPAELLSDGCQSLRDFAD